MIRPDGMDNDRVIVCGGRDFTDAELLYTMLDWVLPRVVIHGRAKGADLLADKWARDRGVYRYIFPAQWRIHVDECLPHCLANSYCYGAGPRRNAEMLKYGAPTLVVAFPGGSGTRDMIKQTKDSGVPLLIVNGRDQDWQFIRQVVSDGL